MPPCVTGSGVRWAAPRDTGCLTTSLKQPCAAHAQVGLDRAGHPKLLAAPLTELQADIPLRPALMGNLVPQQINLWMGAAQEGPPVQCACAGHVTRSTLTQRPHCRPRVSTASAIQLGMTCQTL